MAINKDQKQEIIKKFAKKEGDTGSPEVQIAILTAEISYLTEHIKEHSHDYHSARGLYKKIGQRRRLLDYLLKNDVKRYRFLIAELKLRR